MDVFITLLFMFTVLGGLGALIYWAYRAEKQRTEAVQTLAKRLKFTYQGSKDNYSRTRKRRSLFDTGRESNQYVVSMLSPEAQQFELFKIGTEATIKHLIQGEMRGLQVSVADYTYTTGTSDNKKSRSQTIVILETQQQRFPKFLVTPENFLHRIGNQFGLQDIDFATHPHFSRCYHVRSEDEQSLRRLFTDKVLRFIEREEDKVTLEGNQSALLYYTEKEILEPREWMALVQRAHRLFQQLQSA